MRRHPGFRPNRPQSPNRPLQASTPVPNIQITTATANDGRTHRDHDGPAGTMLSFPPLSVGSRGRKQRWSVRHTIAELSSQTELPRLTRAPAEYTSVRDKSECLSGTRVGIQESLHKHLKEVENRFIWLRGSPGMGKTAISMSVASALEKEGILAASFFWNKNQTGLGLDSIEQFPSTLAHQLASFNKDFKASLIRHLRHPALALVQGFLLEKQMKALIIEPMRDLEDTLSSGKDRFVIVLDGLDECGSHEALEHLMKLVLTLQELPPSFSVLVSCRPEPGVISAWSEARTKGLVVPCEDVDEIAYDDTFRTIYVMVEEGLRDLIDESPWKPIEGELDALARACRQSPVMASIWVRDVRLQTRRGHTLQLAFQNLLTLADAPADFNWEYLRILRQAYMLDSLEIHPDVAKKYCSVVGAIVVARKSITVSLISQLFGIAEDDIRAMLEPISSMIHLPSRNTERVNFYHATAKEFITGDPIGEERDEVFFINDVEGYSLGLPLLRLFNSRCEQNAFGVPTDLPLGVRRKWEGFMVKGNDDYIRSYNFLEHLDPSELFSEESNELRSEFDSFITRNLLTLAQLQPRFIQIPEGFRKFDHHNSIQALRDLEPAANHIAKHGPSYLYRSFLPFAPLSSSIYKLYGSLSDPIRIFSIFGEFSGDTIPSSEDLLSAQEAMQAKLRKLREIDESGIEVVNYEAEFHEPDIRNVIVVCAALSLDGRYVALGFGNGIIEVADIDHQCTVCRLQHDPANPPIWIEFVHGSHRVATEDIGGHVTVLGHDMTPVKLGTLPTGPYSAGTAVSDNESLVIRVPQNFDNPWYDNMILISVLEDPSIQPLASPSSPSSLSSPLIHVGLHTPHRRTLGFSPGAQYIGAFDGIRAFTWSTKSCEFIASYCVTKFDSWIIRSSIIPPSGSYLVPPVEGKAAYTLHSEADAGPDSEDESWIKCPFYDFSPSISRGILPSSVHSSVTGRTPLIESSSVWINGSVELIVPVDFEPHETCAWYGDRIPPDVMGLYRPQSSRDGTRFLLQGQRRAPIVVDISQIRLPSPVDLSGMRDSDVLHSWSSGSRSLLYLGNNFTFAEGMRNVVG